MKMKMKRYSSIVLSVLVTGIVVLGSVFLSSNPSYALRQYMERKMEIPSADVNKLSGNMAMTVGKIGFGRDTPQGTIQTLLWEVDGDFNLGEFKVAQPTAATLVIRIDARTGTLDYTSEANQVSRVSGTSPVDQIIAGSHKGSSMPTMTLLANSTVSLMTKFVRTTKIAAMKTGDDPVVYPFELNKLLLHAVEGSVGGLTEVDFIHGRDDDHRLARIPLVFITPSSASNRAVIKFGIDITLRDYLAAHVTSYSSEEENWRLMLGRIVFTLVYDELS